jgi:putative NADH-flavin reductase
VRQSLDRGHTVTALVRSPERLAHFVTRLNAVPGDFLNPGELSRALTGQDAVLSGFGPRLPLRSEDRDLLERFAGTLTRAISASTCRRAVIVSTAFLFNDAPFPPAHLLGRLFFRSVVNDASAMEASVQSSPLDWVFVRPPRLTDKPLTEKYRQGASVCRCSASRSPGLTPPIACSRSPNSIVTVARLLALLTKGVSGGAGGYYAAGVAIGIEERTGAWMPMMQVIGMRLKPGLKHFVGG